MFTFDFHFADDEKKEVLAKGQTDYARFREEFENFPWLEQLEKAEQTERTSPTTTVQDLDTDTELWVSII